MGSVVRFKIAGSSGSDVLAASWDQYNLCFSAPSVISLPAEQDGGLSGGYKLALTSLLHQCGVVEGRRSLAAVSSGGS